MQEATLIERPDDGPGVEEGAIFAFLQRIATRQYAIDRVTNKAGVIVGVVVSEDATSWVREQAEALGCDVGDGMWMETSDSQECDEGTFFVDS